MYHRFRFILAIIALAFFIGTPFIPVFAETLPNSLPCGKETCQKSSEKCTDDGDCAGNVGAWTCYSGSCYFSPDRQAQESAKVPVFGIDVKTEKVQLQKPVLEISIPGLNFSDVKQTLDKDGYIYIPYIGEFLSAAYKYAVVVGSIIAVIMLIKNGITIVLSAGGEEQMASYHQIGQVIVGLIIMWGSFAILNTINPALTQFRALRIKYIQTEPIPREEDNIPETEFPTIPNVSKPEWSGTTFDCDKKDTYPETGVTPLSSVVSYDCPGIQGSITSIPEMKEPLCAVAALANKAGYQLKVTSSYRPFKNQVDEWCTGKNSGLPPEQRKKYVAVPGYSNHGLGRAVDVKLLKNGESLFEIDRKKQCDADKPLVEQFANFFYTTDAKFKRLETEIWHFEYDTNQSARGQYTTLPSSCN